MKKAAFSLDKYYFSDIKLKLEDSQESENVKISFSPSGEFNLEQSIFYLKFMFKAKQEEESKPFIQIECCAIFSFSDKISFDEIPNYFYVNSIAILFPYVRAFISTITLQANVSPLILPTMNLVDLGDNLKKKTKVI